MAQIIQLKDDQFVALMSMQHGKADKIIITDTYDELLDETHNKDMISMIHYMDDYPKFKEDEDDD